MALSLDVEKRYETIQIQRFYDQQTKALDRQDLAARQDKRSGLQNMIVKDMKAQLRQQVRESRKNFDNAAQDKNSAFVQRFTLDLHFVSAAPTVCAYRALAHEVQIDNLCDLLFVAGKSVLIPAFDSMCDEYRWACLDREGQWLEGKFGVAEPVEPKWAEPPNDAVALVPGLAFDLYGNRLGHGTGFYDRLLTGFHGIKIGVAYSYQLLENVPLEKHDISVQLLVTEDGVHDCRPPENTQPFRGEN